MESFQRSCHLVRLDDKGLEELFSNNCRYCEQKIFSCSFPTLKLPRCAFLVRSFICLCAKQSLVQSASKLGISICTFEIRPPTCTKQFSFFLSLGFPCICKRVVLRRMKGATKAGCKLRFPTNISHSYL